MELELFIESISHNGEGVARNKGKATFIPYAIPKERVKADIVEEKKKYSRGILREIIKESPYRVEPECPHYYQCGGCSYQHIAYTEQLVLKQKIVHETIKRIGGINPVVMPVMGMDRPWYYRNKVLWHICESPNGRKMGFYHYKSRQLIEIKDCALLLPKLAKISSLLKENLSKISLEENSAIMIRQSNKSKETMLTFIHCSPDKEVLGILSREVETIYENRHGQIKLLSGRKVITEKAGESLFSLGPDDFFQVNPRQIEHMIRTVREYLNLSGQNKILDAYCGAGMFSLNMADKAISVVGIDSNSTTIKNARRNAALNGITNCQFISGRCEAILLNLQNSFDRVIVNPPRTGLKPEVINAIIGLSPKIIVYVSCNPATLARDLNQFCNQNYQAACIQPIDMFPQTGHIENIVQLHD